MKFTLLADPDYKSGTRRDGTLYEMVTCLAETNCEMVESARVVAFDKDATQLRNARKADEFEADFRLHIFTSRMGYVTNEASVHNIQLITPLP